MENLLTQRTRVHGFPGSVPDVGWTVEVSR